MENRNSDIIFLEKDGKIYLSSESVEGLIADQAEEIRVNYLIGSEVTTLSKETIVGILVGMRIAKELVQKANDVSVIHDLLNPPENTQGI